MEVYSEHGSGYLVTTKKGKEGRTYHSLGLIGGKTPVFIKDENGKEIKMLCDFDTLKITGYID